MIYEEIPVRVSGSAPYARLQCYIWSWSEEIDIDDRPLIVVVPGGGYHLTTDREAEPVALHFMALGYHVAVLRYSVAPVGWPVSLHEVTRALCLMQARSEQWHIDMQKVTLMGFSAGGHLAASYAVYWQQENNRQDESFLQTDDLSERAYETLPDHSVSAVKPAGLILGYPVISADPAIWHEGSFRQLLQDRFADEKLRDVVSLEKHIHTGMPPVFIWNTKTDDTVPAANSEVFVKALQAKGIPVEYHEYPTGGHGLSLANELSDNRQHWCYWKPCQNWVELAAEWLEKNNLSVSAVQG